MKLATNRRLRQLHHYVGVFFAPAIIFFALTGALQTFGFHEARDGSGPPAKWIAWAASVHKDQAVPHPHLGSNPAPRDDADHRGPTKHKEDSAMPLKVFVGLMAIGLIASALLGVAIALSVRSMRRFSIVMLALGTVLPLALLLA